MNGPKNLSIIEKFLEINENHFKLIKLCKTYIKNFLLDTALRSNMIRELLPSSLSKDHVLPFVKVHQLQALKAKREKSRDIRNLQERILLDTLEDTNIQLGYGPSHRSRSRLPLSKDRDVQQLQLEVMQRRERERERERERRERERGEREVNLSE